MRIFQVGDLVGLLDALECRPPSSSAMTGCDRRLKRRASDRFAPSCVSAYRFGRAARSPDRCHARTADAQFYQLYFRNPASPGGGSSAIRG